MHTASSYLPVHVVRPALKLFDGSSFSPLHHHHHHHQPPSTSTITTTYQPSVPPNARGTSGYQRQTSCRVTSSHVKRAPTFCICRSLKRDPRASSKETNSKVTPSIVTFVRRRKMLSLLYIVKRYIVKRYSLNVLVIRQSEIRRDAERWRLPCNGNLTIFL